jgi:hypothetical protein
MAASAAWRSASKTSWAVSSVECNTSVKANQHEQSGEARYFVQPHSCPATYRYNSRNPQRFLGAGRDFTVVDTLVCFV